MFDTEYRRAADEADGYSDGLHGRPRATTKPYYRSGYDRGLSDRIREEQAHARGFEAGYSAAIHDARISGSRAHYELSGGTDE